MLALTAALVAPYFVDWSSLSRRFRARGERHPRAQGHRERRGDGKDAAFSLGDVLECGGGRRGERRTGDDRRDLLDGRRTRAAAQRRLPYLRYADGAAEGDDRGRRRWRGRLGDAPIVTVRCRPDLDRETDHHRGTGKRPPYRERPHASPDRDQHGSVGEVARRSVAHGRLDARRWAALGGHGQYRPASDGAMRLRIRPSPKCRRFRSSRMATCASTVRRRNMPATSGSRRAGSRPRAQTRRPRPRDPASASRASSGSTIAAGA